MPKPHRLVARAERLMRELQVKLETLCLARLIEWRNEFRAKFPRQHGRIVFGMGTENINIGKSSYGCLDCDDYRALRSLGQAIDDISKITDGYRLGCPEDFEF